MKLYYISPRDLRRNRSDAVHMALSANSFAAELEKVIFISPKVERSKAERNLDLPSLYGLKNFRFELKEIGFRVWENESSFFSILIILSKFFANLFFALGSLKSLNKGAVIYSKCFVSAVPYILLKKIGLLQAPLIFETITPKPSRLYSYIFKNSQGIISHLKFVNEELESNFGVPKHRIFMAPMISQGDAVRRVKKSKRELRQDLDLNRDSFYALYAGKTGKGIKEVDYFIEAAQLLPELDFLIVGANVIALKDYNAQIVQLGISNLRVFPFQTLEAYYKFVLAADTLVGYYPATNHNKYHLAPGKAGVYLSSGNPCIFSDLPSLRSIYPDGSVKYCTPDNPKKLAEAIDWVYKKPVESQTMAHQALEFAMSSNYKRFAQEIIAFIKALD